MSRNLFIRVSAVTYDEKDVKTSWPTLCEIVWPDSEQSYGLLVKGILELSDALVETARFLAPADIITKLEPHLGALGQVRQQLDSALGDQDVQVAKKMATQLELALDAAEKALN